VLGLIEYGNLHLNFERLNCHTSSSSRFRLG
jgi:hypothetical protein